MEMLRVVSSTFREPLTRATRLMRAFAAQVTALKVYLSKGHQTVTVQHVDVRDGGQAIVGDVTLNGAQRCNP